MSYSSNHHHDWNVVLYRPFDIYLLFQNQYNSISKLYTQNNCLQGLEDSYSEYKVCLLNCTDSETKDKCQKACIEQRSNRDDDCLNMTLDLVKPIKDLGDIESGCFYKEESNTSCSYECHSGRRMPFNSIDACSSEL